MGRGGHTGGCTRRFARAGALAGTAVAISTYFVLGSSATSCASDPGRASLAAKTIFTDVSASQYLTLTATSLDALGLAYVGTFTVARTAGDVQVLRFTMTSGSLAGMNLVQACAGGGATVTAAGSASLGSATFDAVSMTVTIGDTPQTFSVTAPPTAAFPSEILLRDLTLTAKTVSADTLTAPSLSARVVTC